MCDKTLDEASNCNGVLVKGSVIYNKMLYYKLLTYHNIRYQIVLNKLAKV